MTLYWLVEVYIVATWRWPNASYSVSSISDGEMPEPRGGVAVDLDRDVRRGDLLVGGDVLQLRQLSASPLDDRRPVVELVDIGVGQRVLVLGAAQAPADADVLPRLHEEFGALDRRHLGAQALDDLVGGHVALVVRLQLDEHAGRYSRSGCRRRRRRKRRRRRPPGLAGRCRRSWWTMLGHLREGGVLARLRLAEDEAGVLLREKALGNDDVEIAGRDHQHAASTAASANWWRKTNLSPRS